MSFTDAMSDLLAFCDKHQASITHLYNDDGKYHIELDYESKGHDGCKCRKISEYGEPLKPIGKGVRVRNDGDRLVVLPTGAEFDADEVF